tara:strand:+ start:8867 stop:12748 length:3882 start_codon:yes stop_codon:yes gene_type:complete
LCNFVRRIARGKCCPSKAPPSSKCQSSVNIKTFRYDNCRGEKKEIRCVEDITLPDFTDGYSEKKCDEDEYKLNTNNNCIKFSKRYKGCFEDFDNSEQLSLGNVKAVLQCGDGFVDTKTYQGHVSCDALESFYSNGEICDPLGAVIGEFGQNKQNNSRIVTGSFFDDVVFDEGGAVDNRDLNSYVPAPNEHRITNYDNPSNETERILDKYRKADTMRLEFPGNFIRFFAERLGLRDFFKDLKRKQDSGDPRFAGVDCDPNNLTCHINPIIFGDHLKNHIRELSDSSDKLEMKVRDHINKDQKKDGIIIEKVSWKSNLSGPILGGVADLFGASSDVVDLFPNILDLHSTWRGALRVRPKNLNRNKNKPVESEVVSFDLKKRANLFPIPLHFPGSANGYRTFAYGYKDNQKYLDSVGLIAGLEYNECALIQRLESHGKYTPWQPWFKCQCGGNQPDTETDKNFCVFDPYKRDKKVEVAFNQNVRVKYQISGLSGGTRTFYRSKTTEGTLKANLFGGSAAETTYALHLLKKAGEAMTINHSMIYKNLSASQLGVSYNYNWNVLKESLDLYTRDNINYPSIRNAANSRQHIIVNRGLEVFCDTSSGAAKPFIYQNKRYSMYEIGGATGIGQYFTFNDTQNLQKVYDLASNFGCAGAGPKLFKIDDWTDRPRVSKVRSDFSSSAMAVEVNAPVNFGKYELEFFRFITPFTGFLPIDHIFRELEQALEGGDYIPSLGGWAASNGSVGNYGAVSVDIRFSAEAEKVFNKNFFSWTLGLIIKTFFKLISAVLSVVANIGFTAVTLLDNNFQLAQFSMEPINLGAHLMILNKENSSNAVNVETKVRRIFSSKPVVTINPYKSIEPDFPNCREMKNFSQVRGPTDFIKWFLRSTVGCVFDSFSEILSFTVLPIQTFFSHITDHFFDLNVDLLKSFVSTEIDSAGNSLDEANDIIKVMKHGLETAKFQANLGGDSLENPFYDEHGDSGLLASFKRTCSHDPSNKLACITWSILQNRDFGTGINICIERMGAKTHYRSLEDLYGTIRKFQPSFNFPPTRFCQTSYGDTPGKNDREIIRNKINESYLWNFNEIYAGTVRLNRKNVKIGWRNQCALFTDIKAKGLLDISASDEPRNGEYNLKAEFIPTERSNYYLNEISVCQDSHRCSPLERPMKNRIKMASCSLAGDLWFRYASTKSPADKGVLNFYDLIEAHMNQVRSSPIIYNLAVAGMLKSYCELECGSNSPGGSSNSENRRCESNCMRDKQEMIDDLYGAYNDCVVLLKGKNIRVSDFEYSPEPGNSENSTCE